VSGATDHRRALEDVIWAIDEAGGVDALDEQTRRDLYDFVFKMLDAYPELRNQLGD
jgi:hypothetical protein